VNNEPKIITDRSGNKFWYFNGLLHREDGPAIEGYEGSKAWYLNGKLHRTDGPAVEWAKGAKDWYIYGYSFSSKEEWFKALTPEQQINYLWNLNE
jgi:hypothetical protein